MHTSSILQLLAQAAMQYGLDPALVTAVARQESGLNPNAVSSAGAQGVMQLMPSTAAQFGVTNPLDPVQNINAGVKYLAQLLNQFGDLGEALAAYNWGPGNVSNALQQWGPDWLLHAPAETQNYVQTIAGITPATYAQPAAPPITGPSPITIDASTGQVIEDATGTPLLDPSVYAAGLLPQTPSTGIGTYLLWAGLALAALWIFEEAT
jgi:hypothetical protein